MNRTVGTKEGIGAGIIGLAVLMIFLPGRAQEIADLEFVASDAFTILLGAVYVIAFILIGAGLAVMFANFNDEEVE